MSKHQSQHNLLTLRPLSSERNSRIKVFPIGGYQKKILVHFFEALLKFQNTVESRHNRSKSNEYPPTTNVINFWISHTTNPPKKKRTRLYTLPPPPPPPVTDGWAGAENRNVTGQQTDCLTTLLWTKRWTNRQTNRRTDWPTDQKEGYRATKHAAKKKHCVTSQLTAKWHYTQLFQCVCQSICLLQVFFFFFFFFFCFFFAVFGLAAPA